MHTDREKAKHVIATIIARYPRELRGRFRLVKAFYYAHLFYWRDHAETLTDYPLIKMDRGPGVKDYKALIGELIADGYIKQEITDAPDGESERLFSSVKPAKGLDCDTPRALAAIDEACKCVAGYTREQLVEKVHAESHSWNEAKEGAELDIYRDLMTGDEYQRMRAELDSLRKKVNLG